MDRSGRLGCDVWSLTVVGKLKGSDRRHEREPKNPESSRLSSSHVLVSVMRRAPTMVTDNLR